MEFLQLLSKKFAFAVLLFTSGLLCKGQEAKIELSGNYQGKNLYIQNPFSGTGVDFCVTKVLVNGKETADDIKSSAFEINLKKLDFKPGDSVFIQIFHKKDCKPKVMQEYGKPKSTFEATLIKIDSSGNLIWKTKNENGKMPFIIEQFRWNKWVKIGEVDGKGGEDENEYSFKITAAHSGENQFRIKQVDYSSQPNYTKPIKGLMCIPEVTIVPRCLPPEERCIEFTSETMYELYDTYGNIIKKGIGKTIDCSSLKKGVYSLNYDNKTTEFSVPKKK